MEVLVSKSSGKHGKYLVVGAHQLRYIAVEMGKIHVVGAKAENPSSEKLLHEKRLDVPLRIFRSVLYDEESPGGVADAR